MCARTYDTRGRVVATRLFLQSACCADTTLLCESLTQPQVVFNTTGDTAVVVDTEKGRPPNFHENKAFIVQEDASSMRHNRALPTHLTS